MIQDGWFNLINPEKEKCGCGLHSIDKTADADKHSTHCPVYEAWQKKKETDKTFEELYKAVVL